MVGTAHASAGGRCPAYALTSRVPNQAQRGLGFVKSNKQRRAELKAKKARKAYSRMVAVREDRLIALARDMAQSGGAAVDRDQLAPDGSYSHPDFVERGYYVDKPFICQDCGVPQTWTAVQQKWWYEVAKGSVWTTATRCRPCRLRERTRQEAARRIHLEGLAHKRRDL